ncbi:MAG: hypothetical protein R3320_13315, partial [Nitriliruptorales bacterium]|nr:hypothetical protein [Nitriliruptorales bacterium]
MSDRGVVVLLRSAAAVGAVLTVGGCAVWMAIGGVELWLAEFGPLVGLFALFFAGMTWVVAPRQPRNAVVWVLASSAFFGGVYFVGAGGAMAAGGDPALVVLESVVPARLPDRVAWILMLTAPAVLVMMFPLITFGLLLFPDGRLPSPRWRSVAVAAGVGILATALGWGWGLRPGHTGIADRNLLINAGFAITLPAAGLSLAGLIVRYRRTRGEDRDRFRWIVWGAALFVPAVVVASALGGTRYEAWSYLPVLIGGAAYVGAYGIALTRYQLFDVDVAISRTVVVAGLAAFITVVYVAVVGGVGLLLGTGTDADLPLSVVATALVAVAFQPARERMRGWAHRLVYGDRATPYEVLSHPSARIRETVAAEELIPRMAELLAAGTGAQRATVWLRSDGQLVAAASHPAPNEPLDPIPLADAHLSLRGRSEMTSVEHDGELLGAIQVTLPTGHEMTATERR